MSGPPAPAHCAQCGADIPRDAHACPACGADERTGWREQNIYDGLDLPDEESAPGSSMSESGRAWRIVGLILLAMVVVLVVLNRFWIAP